MQLAIQQKSEFMLVRAGTPTTSAGVRKPTPNAPTPLWASPLVNPSFICIHDAILLTSKLPSVPSKSPKTSCVMGKKRGQTSSLLVIG